jgi:uncharacterized membrane protein
METYDVVHMVLGPIISFAGLLVVWVASRAAAKSRALRLKAETMIEGTATKRLSWLAWIYLQVLFPAACGIVAAGYFGIPFALIWPPMTKAQAWLSILLGFGSFVLCLWSQRRKMYLDGMLPPFS